MIKYVASVSCGKDSTAMVLNLIEKNCPLDYVVFVDTGKEFDSIYSTWKKLTDIFTEHKIPFKRLKFDRSFDYYFSEHQIKARDGSTKQGYSWCGGLCRWGTTFKNQVLRNFYKNTFENCTIVEYVGIAKDELNRIRFDRSTTVKVYPLVLWNMTENDALVYCLKRGFSYTEKNDVNLYDVLDRGSCYCCANKNLKELEAIYRYLPEYWQRLKQMQSKTDKLFKNIGLEALELRFKH